MLTIFILIESLNASLLIYINGLYSWYQPTDTTEVIIVGQRTLETIRLRFDITEPIEVCEIEMIGKIIFFKNN